MQLKLNRRFGQMVWVLFAWPLATAMAAAAAAFHLSLTHSPTHLPYYPLTHPLTHSPTHPPVCPLRCAFHPLPPPPQPPRCYVLLLLYIRGLSSSSQSGAVSPTVSVFICGYAEANQDPRFTADKHIEGRKEGRKIRSSNGRFYSR